MSAIPRWMLYSETDVITRPPAQIQTVSLTSVLLISLHFVSMSSNNFAHYGYPTLGVWMVLSTRLWLLLSDLDHGRGVAVMNFNQPMNKLLVLESRSCCSGKLTSSSINNVRLLNWWKTFGLYLTGLYTCACPEQLIGDGFSCTAKLDPLIGRSAFSRGVPPGYHYLYKLVLNLRSTGAKQHGCFAGKDIIACDNYYNRLHYSILLTA